MWCSDYGISDSKGFEARFCFQKEWSLFRKLVIEETILEDNILQILFRIKVAVLKPKFSLI